MSHDPSELFPPDRYICVKDVAIFKTHERVKNGKKIKITRKELQQICDNHNKKFERIGVALPSSEGHTLDKANGDDVDEKDQPDITGWFVNYRVAKYPTDPDDEYLIADWYVRKDKEYVITDYPSRSVELYPSTMELWPVANLKTSRPELDLPIVKYEASRPDEDPIRLTLSNPITYSLSYETEQMPNCDDDKMKAKKKYEDDAVDAKSDVAKSDETKGAKSDASDLSEIKQMLAALQPLIEAAPKLMQLVAMLDEEQGDDGMKPDDKMGDKPEADAKKDVKKDVPSDKPKMADEKPVDFNAALLAPVAGAVAGKVMDKVGYEQSMGGSTNGFVPSMDKDKYKMTNDEVAKYKSEVAKMRVELEATKKIADDLHRKNRLAEAEKMVYRLENEFLVALPDDKVRQEEVETLAALDAKSAEIYFERAKVRYQKKTPAAESVKEVAKYATEDKPNVGANTPEEAQARALKALEEKNGVSLNALFQKIAGK